MLARRIVLILVLGVGLVSTSASAQTPGIDGQRWTTQGGVALSQPQGTGQGAPTFLTWGFAADGTSIPSFGAGDTADSDLISRFDTLYGAGPGGADLTTRPWFQSVESSFDRWASISGLTFQYESADDGRAFTNFNSSNFFNNTSGSVGTRADIRLGGRPIDGDFDTLAFNFPPEVGEMVIDTDDNFYSSGGATNSNFRGLRNVITHELGHAIGMVHVFASDSNQLLEPELSTAFDGPQYHDILVAQRGYGDANEKSNAGQGNDQSQISTTLGSIADGQTASVGDSARTFVVPISSDDFVSIDDSTDVDFWDFSVSEAGIVDVSLDALGFSYLTQPQGNDGEETGTNVLFDTRLRSDLSLELLASDGLTVLSSSDITGLGGDELISNFSLTSGGTYFLRISGRDNSDAGTLDTQFYGLSVGFTSTAAAAVPEPSSFALIGMGVVILASRRRKDANA